MNRLKWWFRLVGAFYIGHLIIIGSGIAFVRQVGEEQDEYHY